MSCKWQENYREIKEKHDRAYHILKDACDEDVSENLEVALEKYKTGLVVLNSALSVLLSDASNSQAVDETWYDATKMLRQMQKAKPEIELRVETLTRSLEEKRFRERNPTTFSELVRALKEIESSTGSDATRELVFCCENVKFYSIKPEGNVTLTLDNTLLEIWKYTKASTGEEQQQQQSDRGIFFMQITKTSEPVLATAAVNNLNGAPGEEAAAGEANGCSAGGKNASDGLAEIVWTYPLLPGVSPCFRTRFGAIILPDLRAHPSAGATVGMQVEGPPDEVLMEILDEILKCVYRQGGEEKHLPKRHSRAVSEKITKGAFYFSQGLIRGSQKTGEFITYTTPYLISRMEKAPITVAPVSVGVRTGVEVAKTVSGTAASVTGFMAQKLGTATMALGRFIAPHIQKQGSRLLSQGLGMSHEDASEKVADALTVAAGAVEAFGTVYTGLEKSATILGQSLSSNSVRVIEHKYGPSAGNLASNTFETAGNVFAVSQNVRLMTPKGIAKKAAKSTGRALVEDFQPHHSGSSRDVATRTDNGNM